VKQQLKLVTLSSQAASEAIVYAATTPVILLADPKVAEELDLVVALGASNTWVIVKLTQK
jgi:hypothetical protein